jgi:uncharacterized protein
MSAQDDTHPQADVIAFLSDPAAYGGTVETVGRIDTHAAIVFLAGDEVYKIKRAVTFPFLDFSTLEKRKHVCAREVEVNRLTAPDLYLGTVAVTRADDGTLALDGDGEPVEWTVHMRRFDETATLDRLAGETELDSALIDRLAEQVAHLHDKAPVATVADPAAGVAWVARENCEEMGGFPGLFPPGEVADLLARTDAALDRLAPLTEARAKAGFIRRCHGDLHLGNVALIDGTPVIFDAIEFNEDFATIDVLYDLAFLIMDLWKRGLRSEANRVLNRWLVHRRRPDDLDGLALLPLFLSMRAAIRAKVAAPRAAHLDGAKRDAAEAEARAMFTAARAFLDPAPARLVAIGGLSGTGKTTVANGIAANIGPAPGAVVVRSDVIRKVLFDVSETTRLPEQAYTREAAARVYAVIEAWAARVLNSGHGAILDAVHSRPAEREAARAVAEKANVPFDGIWLEAKPESLIKRVSERIGDASDATADVVRKQLAYETGPIDWTVVDTGGGPGEAIDRTCRALGIKSSISSDRS